jgi:hypothetical protein
MQGKINRIRYIVKARKPRKLSGHAPLLRKAVEPICYISERLSRPNVERRVPAKSDHGRNHHDFNQQSLHV